MPLLRSDLKDIVIGWVPQICRAYGAGAAFLGNLRQFTPLQHLLDIHLPVAIMGALAPFAGHAHETNQELLAGMEPMPAIPASGGGWVERLGKSWLPILHQGKHPAQQADHFDLHPARAGAGHIATDKVCGLVGLNAHGWGARGAVTGFPAAVRAGISLAAWVICSSNF